MPDDASIARFRAEYPGVEPCAFARAPGRVNLIGEHIDYNDGLVLPIAIGLETRVVIGRTPASRGRIRIRIRSGAQPDELNYDAAAVPDHASQTWDAYPRGVAVLLAKRGIRLPGCAIWIESDIPPGAGLSSSAALEIGIALALLAAANASLPMQAIADLCRETEHRFAGVPCGIMDQYVCALARRGHALAIDCRDRSFRHVPWPKSNPAVLIVNTGIRRRLADGAYEVRVRECAEALVEIRRGDPSVQSWRDVTASHLAAAESRLSDVLRRRARHVVNEIERTPAAITSMEIGDLAGFGELMDAGHASLSRDYEVSLPLIDYLVTTLQNLPGVYGAKLTGAGFGGCVVALVNRMAIDSIQSALADVATLNFDGMLRCHATAPAAGATGVNT